MQINPVLNFLIIFVTLLGGCSRPDKFTSDTSSSNLVNESPGNEAHTARGSFVFRAKYHRTTGPCIEMGDTLAMPLVDVFEVVEVLGGDLKIKNIHVRAMTEGGVAYPQDLEEGKIYSLRFRPSESTKKQMSENEEKGHPFLWVDGREIEAYKTAH